MKNRPGMNDDGWRQVQAARTWANANRVSDTMLPPRRPISIWDDKPDLVR